MGSEAGGVDLRIQEKAGKVQVSVRTPDAELSSSLQSNLGDLVDRLERKGFDTEAWAPSFPHAAAAAGSTDSPQGNPDQGGYSQNGQSGSQSQDGSGGGGGGRQQGQGRPRPQWVEEMEHRFSREIPQQSGDLPSGEFK
jgi:hypothetical protein